MNQEGVINTMMPNKSWCPRPRAEHYRAYNALG
nr:MAG TPA_asm: glycoside hydrolase family protein [Caudoviricetes sp.]